MPDITLEYATPPKPRKQPYWLMLFAFWISSLPVVNILDNILKRHLDGGYQDGGAGILAMLAVCPAAMVAAFLKRNWYVAALMGGLCSPVAMTAIYLFWP
ncbi:MAG: hypothetical protein QM754_07820 [Tepidisphaeraceae bacterium]